MWLSKQDLRIRFLIIYWLIISILSAEVWYSTNEAVFSPLFFLLIIATLPLGLILPAYLHGDKSTILIAGIVFALINSYVFCIIVTLRLRKKS